MTPDARSSSARFAVAIVATLATLSLVAAPPALAQLNFTSTDVSIFGNTPQSVVASDFDGDSHFDLATADNGTFLDDGGVDVLLGAGADRINARGGGRDRVICGRGRDMVRADDRDRVRGCEGNLR